MTRQLLFSVTKKEFEMQTFRAGGRGGQRQDKVETAVRYVHRESGAVGIATENRKREVNRKNAFNRCVNSKKFQAWLKIEISKKTGEYIDIEKKVNDWVQKELYSDNVKIECLNEDGTVSDYEPE